MASKKHKIIVPFAMVMPNHLEFEVEEDATTKTFSVIEHTCAGTPDIVYTGFPTRKIAEQFVLAQPEPWE